MKAAIYARVSTERQAERGTIGSQLAVLRDQVSAAGHELVGEFIDDGHSGARLDRPGLDSLAGRRRGRSVRRGLVPVTGPVGPRLRLPGPRARRTGPHRCQSRLRRRPRLRPRRPASQAAHPGAGRDRRIRKSQDRRTLPARQAVPLPRREVITWRAALRLPPAARSAATGPAHLEIYEPEAEVVRRIFPDTGPVARHSARSAAD